MIKGRAGDERRARAPNPRCLLDFFFDTLYRVRKNLQSRALTRVVRVVFARPDFRVRVFFARPDFRGARRLRIAFPILPVFFTQRPDLGFRILLFGHGGGMLI